MSLDGIEIKFHRLGYGDRMTPAVLVKDMKYYEGDPDYKELYENINDEDVVSSLYEKCCELFWMNAKDIADYAGYGTVYSEGRSGGWLIVSEPPDIEPELREDNPYPPDSLLHDIYELGMKEKLMNITPSYNGDPGSDQGIAYNDGREAGELITNWIEFERMIESEMDHCREVFLNDLQEYVDDRDAEAAEAKAMAERDIVTVDSRIPF